MKLDKIHLKETENIVEAYNPIPPKRSERVTMRAQFKGRGKPLPYPIDEGIKKGN